MPTHCSGCSNASLNVTFRLPTDTMFGIAMETLADKAMVTIEVE